MNRLEQSILEAEARVAHRRQSLSSDSHAVRERIVQRATSPVTIAALAATGVAAAYFAGRRTAPKRAASRRRSRNQRLIPREVQRLAWRLAAYLVGARIATKTAAEHAAEATAEATTGVGVAPPPAGTPGDMGQVR